jgi:hypothetical protein
LLTGPFSPGAGDGRPRGSGLATLAGLRSVVASHSPVRTAGANSSLRSFPIIASFSYLTGSGQEEICAGPRFEMGRGKTGKLSKSL